MNLPLKRIEILKLLRRYFILRNGQIRARLLPHDDGSLTRAHLRKLAFAGLVRKYQPKIVDPMGNGSAPPVYTITTKGASVLAAETGDASYLLRAEVSFSQWVAVNHWCSLGSLAMVIDDAIAAQDYVRLTAMRFEHEVVAPDETDPSKRYFLHTKVSDKVFFCPDHAFETCVQERRRAFYGEYQTGSEGPPRVAAKKHKGIEAFTMDHLIRHFPEAKSYRVVFWCPNAGWRDALRKEFKDKFKTKPDKGEMVLFCATNEVTAANFLHGPLLYSIDNGPFPLVPRPS